MKIRDYTKIAMTAAVYCVLCLTPGLNAIAFGQLQIRFAEALTVLPVIYRNGIFGVTLGCFMSNLIGAMTGINPTGMIDSVIGTAATFLAAVCTYYFRDRRVKGIPVLSMAMPVIFNFVFIGAELAFLFMPDNFLTGFLINGTYVAVGELIAVTIGWLIVRRLAETELFK
ncbi:MAG: QueT transporter family protein [Solobacterium sp.]|nr:QueT transporter family protein [Solobacterium sp.]